jgi:hypothetical protein
MITLRSVLLLTIALLMLGSCDKLSGAMKSVEGKVAGQVLNSAGRGRGYVTVEIVPEGTDGGKPQTTLAEDSGNFMFENVTPGSYKMFVRISGGTELPSDNPIVKVGPGRTVTQNVILTDQPAT